MKNNIETLSYSIHEGGYHKEKHLMLKMQNNFQDKFLDSILFDPDKTDRTEFFELKEALELVRFTEFLIDFISKDTPEMDAIVDYNYRITQGITVDELLKMQNNFQDYFLDSILFDPDKTDRAEFFELKEALELVRFTEFLLDFISKDTPEMDAIVDYNYRITQGITVDELLKMSDENIKKALLDLHKRMYNLQ